MMSLAPLSTRGAFRGPACQKRPSSSRNHGFSPRLRPESFKKTGHIQAHFLAKNSPRGRGTDRSSLRPLEEEISARRVRRPHGESRNSPERRVEKQNLSPRTSSRAEASQ